MSALCQKRIPALQNVVKDTTKISTTATGGYFFAALTGSLTFSTVANSMFQSSPFTLSTLRI
jgi:hypothetical protein